MVECHCAGLSVLYKLDLNPQIIQSQGEQNHHAARPERGTNTLNRRSVVEHNINTANYFNS
jgi:hypothetical protein